MEAKLLCCVRELNHRKKNSFDSLKTEILKKQKRLVGLLENDDQGANHEAKKIQMDIQGLLEKEELWWKQRAKEDWLKFGDRNTKYYHACVNSRRQRNWVETIVDENGVLWNTPEEVGEAFVHYYAKLFTMGKAGDLNPYIQPISCRISAEMNVELTKNFTAEEVIAALFQMSPLKASGSDGLNACFFQKNWPTIGVEVCSVILDILNSGQMPPDMNMTHVTLVTKV